MTIRKKSRERPAKVEEAEAGPVFEEVASPLPNAPEVMTPTVLETPVVSTTRNGRVVGLGTTKRMASESLDANSTTRKVVGFNIKRMTGEALDVNVEGSIVGGGGRTVVGFDNKRMSMAGGEGLEHTTKAEGAMVMGPTNKRIASEGLDSRACKRKATRENAFDMNTRVPIPRHVVLLPKLDEEATFLNTDHREGQVQEDRRDKEGTKEGKEEKEKLTKGEIRKRKQERKKRKQEQEQEQGQGQEQKVEEEEEEGEEGEGVKVRVLVEKRKDEEKGEKNTKQSSSTKVEKATDYNLTIRPLMGPSFEISLSGDCSILELKDTIYEKIGILPEMQLLGSTKADTNIDFNNEEQFLSETGIGKEEVLHLSVKASTGLKMTNEINVGEDEYFMYEILSPDEVGVNTDIDIDVEGFSTASGNSSSTPPTTTTSPLGSSLTATDNDSESVEITANIPSKTTVLPISGLDSYLKNVFLNKSEVISAANGDKRLALHIEGLEALRISMSPYDESKILSRPTTPFTPVLLLPSEESKHNNCKDKEEKPLLAPIVETGPVRCNKCGIRLRLAGQFLCRCGLKFCGEHRYYDKHACDFDHKSNDRARLDSANPRVYKSTVEKL